MHYILPLIMIGMLAAAVCVLTRESGRAIRRGDEKAKQRYGRNDETNEHDSGK